MTRHVARIVVIAVVALAIPRAAGTEPFQPMARVGYLSSALASEPGSEIRRAAFVQGLRASGYDEGSNLRIEYRFSDGDGQDLAELATGLVRSKVDVIVAASDAAALQARRATKTIPIVVLASHDGVSSGLFANLASPGGNVTGIEGLAPEWDGERIRLLLDVLPRMTRVVLLSNPTARGTPEHLRRVTAAVEALRIAVQGVEVRSPDALAAAFAFIGRERRDALLPVTDALVFRARARIVSLAAEHGVPAVYEYREFVELGGLMSYGPDVASIWRRGATYVDKILKGAKPADLPVEHPATVELAINLKTARALGLTVPASLLRQADHLID